MARPLSEGKRTALLTAATAAVAAAGIAASTITIAKNAGVAEGTLFVYFPTKDVLLNHLYLHLKSDLRSLLAIGFPANAATEDQMKHLWSRLVDWSASDPHKGRALLQLGVSERITKASRDTGEAMFGEFQAVITNGFEKGTLRKQPISFLGGTIQSLADMVLQMAARYPGRLDQYKSLGWAALWGAVSCQE